jgi:hypothetical protein
MSESLPSPTILECRKYKASVIANSVAEYEVTVDEADDVSVQYALFRCAQCASPFLACRDGEPAQDDRDGSYYTAYGPWRQLHPSAPGLAQGVPENIAKGYREAAACFGVGSYTSAAIMCRRTIEAICVDKGATKSTLARKLEELREREIIAPQLLDWAHQLRDVGNDAAHKVDEFIEADDAQDVIEFTRAIIEYVYVFTDAFERFKGRRVKRREKQEKPKPPASPPPEGA